MVTELLSDKCREIHSYDRQRCIEELLSFRDIPLDFSADYLEGMSLERLRHILLAAHVTAMRQHQPAG